MSLVRVVRIASIAALIVASAIGSRLRMRARPTRSIRQRCRREPSPPPSGSERLLDSGRDARQGAGRSLRQGQGAVQRGLGLRAGARRRVGTWPDVQRGPLRALPSKQRPRKRAGARPRSRARAAGAAQHSRHEPKKAARTRIRPMAISCRTAASAIACRPKAARIVTYSAREVSFADGEKVTPARAEASSSRICSSASSGRDIMISPRIAPAVVGMGLLEAVPEASDTGLRQGTGEARRRRASRTTSGTTRPSRPCSGASAGRPISPACASRPLPRSSATSARPSSVFPEENCPAAQKQCLDVPSASKCGGQGGCTGNYRPEVIPSRLSNITLYLQALAVPARRNVNDAGGEARRGAVRSAPRAALAMCPS